MDLRQWESNMDRIHEQQITSVLGLKWDKGEDELFCSIPKKWTPDDIPVITKRNVLSLVAQVFDPLGFCVPALLQPKLMLQESWILKRGWDEEWSQDEAKKFLKWTRDLQLVTHVRVPRNAFGSSHPEGKLSLHMFCDASQHAYAAVVFVRVEEDDKVAVQLLSAKSRLAPVGKTAKKITIPRLELMGCLIGSRLLNSVVKALSLSHVTMYLWSDSSVALAWIRRDEDWGTFVGNRVREIRKLTEEKVWRHVPGVMNPADLPSRGCSFAELVESKWWEGPAWLKESEDKWPITLEDIDEAAVSCEKKKSAQVNVLVPVLEPRFSSYRKNVNVRAWVRRFIMNCKKKAAGEKPNHCKYLYLDELRLGERDLIKEIQEVRFPSMPKLPGLCIVQDKIGLLHVKTRLLQRDDTELFKLPFLLPKDNPYVLQLIEYAHRSNCHGGTQSVLGSLREKYWIVHGRRTVQRVIRKCVVCKRHSTKPMECDPAPLPVDRVKTSWAFQTTGVDLAGPLVMKGGKKAWVVHYTCAVYRGVFLDVVESISTESFLDSLEKFTNIIGRPSKLYSDNGTNFVGANSLMKLLDYKKLETKLHVREIRWSFNPPTAAWWGGFWERLVKTLKDLLKRMIGTAKLTLLELNRCLWAISHTINSRPLTTVTEDGDDLLPLTPNMFLRDLPVPGLREREHLSAADLRGAYKKLTALKEALQQRFRKEYLANLVQRRNEKQMKTPDVGDIVLVGMDNKKRFEWPLGRILEIFPGRDKKVRVAKVKTAKGVLMRPLQRLYPLEVSSSEKVAVPVKIVEETTKQVPDAESRVTETRSGRRVNKPCRYGTWNY